MFIFAVPTARVIDDQPFEVEANLKNNQFKTAWQIRTPLYPAERMHIAR